MGWLAEAMPLPVPCSSRLTEVRSLPYAELCCLDDHRYYAALRLPPHHPGLRVWLIPGIASAALDVADGCGRASPVDRPTFAACRLLYAGAVPGCSRFHGPDCCLRPKVPGSTRSVPHGVFFRRGRVHVRCGLQLRFSSLQRRDLARRRRLTSPLLWRLAGAGLTPADRSALCRAHHCLNSEIELGRGVLDLIRTHRDRVGSPRFVSRHQSQRHRLALQAEPEMVASAW